MDITKLQALPTLVDAQLKVEQHRVALQVRRTHLAKQGKADKETDELFEKVQTLEKWINRRVAKMLEAHPAYHWFSQVKGVGGTNIGKVVGLVDIEKAPHTSSLWKFCGMHVGEDGKAPKKEQGKALDYNSQLRSMCWRLGTSLLRAQGKYADYYYQEKDKYISKYSQSPYKIVPADKLPKIEGKKREALYEGIHYISEGHIHNMAMRKMIKMFLAMLWVVWRKEEGLPVTAPYPVEHLGHNHVRQPEEFIG